MAEKHPRRKKARLVVGMKSVELSKRAFVEQFKQRFFDPDFDAVRGEIERIAEIAWTSYIDYHKSPRTKQAGRGFEDPTFELPLEWLATRRAIKDAEKRQRDRRSKTRILVVNGSARSDQSCPGEVSKTWRMAKLAESVLQKEKRVEVDFLDLSLLVSQYGKVIFPCKACVSTAQPLCHWPCSCYPNHALGQVRDWMNEIYPRWSAAHGVLIVAPVNWYQAPSVLKLMIDRLVCADGGNPDPTTTGGKDPLRAKKLELAGWEYPKHLAGRAFAVVVHGDAAGAENLRRMLCDWLVDMDLIPAGPVPGIDRYIGYYEPYATSHDDYDRDDALHTEIANHALTLLETCRQIRAGTYRRPDEGLEEPRPK